MHFIILQIVSCNLVLMKLITVIIIFIIIIIIIWDQARDVTPRLEVGGWFLIFDYSSPFSILLIEINYTFSISYIVLTSYVYYYCIW